MKWHQCALVVVAFVWYLIGACLLMLALRGRLSVVIDGVRHTVTW